MFSDPHHNINQCGIQVGMEIADFGVGSGFYALEASRSLMATGRVYAIDAQRDLLTRVKNNAVKQGLHNIEVIWGDIEKKGGTKLKDHSIDLVLVCNVLFQVDHKLETIREAKRVLKPRGRVLIIDWSESFGGIGPSRDMILKKEVVTEMCEKEGLSLDRNIQAGDHHYGMIYKKL